MQTNDDSRLESDWARPARSGLRWGFIRVLVAFTLSVVGPAGAAIAWQYGSWIRPLPADAPARPPVPEPVAVATPTAAPTLAETAVTWPSAPLEQDRRGTVPHGLEIPVEITSDELVARALAYNPDLWAARAEVEAAWGQILQLGLWPRAWPAQGAQPSVAGVDSILVGLMTPQNLNLPRTRPSLMATLEYQMKRVQVADRGRTLRAEVRMKTGEILAARQRLRITEELLEVNRQALDLIHARVEHGAAAPLEEGMQRVELNRLEARHRTLEARVQILEFQLKMLAGLAPDAPLSVRGDLHSAHPTLAREEAIAQALATRPDLMMARAEIGMARVKPPQEMTDMQMGMMGMMGMIPDPGFGLSALPVSGGLQSYPDISPYAKGRPLAPLPFQNIYQGKVITIAARVQAAQHRLNSLTLMIRQEIAAGFTQYEATQHALSIYRHGVRELARQNLEVIRKSYELGRIPLLEVINEQRKYIDIEMGYTDALKEVYDAVVEIERVVGAIDL